MAFKKIRNDGYIVDTKEDLKALREDDMGAMAYVIKEAAEYRLMSTGEWIKQTPNIAAVGGQEIDVSGFVTAEELDAAINAIEIPSIEGLATNEFVEESIASIQIPSTSGLATVKSVEDLNKYIENCYRPIKYEIVNVPEGTSIDYRDKEIRVFCQENAKFEKQTVGETGNPNMYYATLKVYAPEGAVSLKEGDRGVIIDEMIQLKHTDAFGRKYKPMWIALANYDDDLDVWSYFGKTSTTSKYLGWNYIVEWYDANGKMINTDAIRINLSNADCHNSLAPYYG